jgi:hypothetical protein
VTDQEALEKLAADPHIKRYRYLCSDENPDAFGRAVWREKIVVMAKGGRPSYPPVLQQLGSAASAVGRAAAAAVTGQPVLVSAEERQRRLAICHGCESWDPQQSRCRLCGCSTNQKVALATESCPASPPKWQAVTSGS